MYFSLRDQQNSSLSHVNDIFGKENGPFIMKSGSYNECQTSQTNQAQKTHDLQPNLISPMFLE